MSKKFTLFSILALIIFSINVSADFTIDSNSLDLELVQGESHTFYINITSTNPVEPINLTFEYTEMKDNDNDKIILEIYELLTIEPLQSKLAEFSMNIPKHMDLDQYFSTITISQENSTEKETFDLSIQVNPGICDFGPAGSDLILDLKDPDSGDDFGPGDEIKIRAEVENTGNDDIRVQLEAFLYDEDSVIESTSSKTENIEEGEDEEFIFYLTIPDRNGEIDDDENYVLFVKAFDDDNEDENCIQTGFTIDIELEKHKVEIREDMTYFLPEILSCGETTSLIVNAQNLGEKDEDVYFEIENPSIGIYKVSDTFELEDFNSNEDNEASRNFKIEIPENTLEGTYDFLIRAIYSGGKADSITLPLEVLSCSNTKSNMFTKSPSATMNVQSNTYLTLSPKDSELIHITLDNNEPTNILLFLTIKEISDFAETTSRTITLQPFESTNVFIPLNLFKEAEQGIYTGIIELSDGINVLSSETLNIEVVPTVSKASQATENKGSFAEIPYAVLIMANMALLIILGAVISLLRSI
jgi:uncharacterized membrane protein